MTQKMYEARVKVGAQTIIVLGNDEAGVTKDANMLARILAAIITDRELKKAKG